MHIAELRAADLDAVLGLIRALDMHPIDHLPYVRFNTLDDATSAPDLRLLAREDGRLVGMVFGCVRELHNVGPAGIVKLFGVHPDYRRRRIATALFDSIEAAFAARGLAMWAVEGVGPHWFFGGVELTQTPAMSFLLHRGYTTDRVARVDMRVDLRAANLEAASEEALLRAEGIVLRRATAEDLPATLALVDACFSPGWHVEVADSGLFVPRPLFIAAQGQRVVAFAAYDVSGPRRFGPTGTDPDLRRKGIGGALLKMCLRDMRERGDRECEIGWVGPIGFYARAVGAEIHRAYWSFRKGTPAPQA